MGLQQRTVCRTLDFSLDCTWVAFASHLSYNAPVLLCPGVASQNFVVARVLDSGCCKVTALCPGPPYREGCKESTLPGVGVGWLGQGYMGSRHGGRCSCGYCPRYLGCRPSGPVPQGSRGVASAGNFLAHLHCAYLTGDGGGRTPSGAADETDCGHPSWDSGTLWHQNPWGGAGGFASGTPSLLGYSPQKQCSRLGDQKRFFL